MRVDPGLQFGDVAAAEARQARLDVAGREAGFGEEFPGDEGVGLPGEVVIEDGPRRAEGALQCVGEGRPRGAAPGEGAVDVEEEEHVRGVSPGG